MKSRLEKYKEKQVGIEKEEKEKRHSKIKKKFNKFLIFIIVVFCICVVYARVIEPNMLFTHEYKIVSKKITDEFYGLKIVHLSDLHYGSTIFEKQLQKLVTEVNRIKPDIIVFTGDLIDERYQKKLDENDIKIIIKYFKEMNSTLGKYAIMGNHDIDKENISNILFDANFILLNNNYDLIYGKNGSTIGIYGFDDTVEGSPNTEKLLSDEYKNTTYKIVLLHEPDYIDNFINEIDIDLALAGHSHGGQVRIPFINPIWTPNGSKKYYDYYYKVNNTNLYVSNGLGESILNLRFSSPPSINLFRLSTAK